MIADCIPVLLKEPYRYLAMLAIHLGRDLVEREVAIEELKSHIHSRHPRRRILKRLETAMSDSSNFLNGLYARIGSEIEVADLLSVTTRPGPPVHYTTTLDYLIRDWCWLPESEVEIEQIESQLFGDFLRLVRERASVLVLGAGAGRFAWDMTELFAQVYAVDTSLMMPYQFRHAAAGLTSYAVSTANAFSTEQMVRRLRASILPPGRTNRRANRARLQRFAYAVADATHVPLSAQSVSAITSIYFTDLIPIEVLLREATRVLRPGGFFVHFGPLDYHFSDVAYHLATEEIKSALESRGFKIRSEAVVPTKHLAFRNPMSTRLYNNWYLMAQLASV